MHLGGTVFAIIEKRLYRRILEIFSYSCDPEIETQIVLWFWPSSNQFMFIPLYLLLRVLNDPRQNVYPTKSGLHGIVSIDL